MTTQVWRDMTEVAVRPNQDTRWVRYSDVRMPVTVAEADSALDLISTKIANIEARLADNPGNEPELENALTKWGERLVEVEWTTARLRAGEVAPSMDLARERASHAETIKKLDAARAQVKSLESKVATLARYRHTEASESKVGGLRAELDRLRVAIDDRNAKIERGTAGLREHVASLNVAIAKRDAMIESLRAPSGEVPMRARGEDPRGAARQHEMSASALEAIDDMVAGGAQHTLLSQYMAWKLASVLPIGYRVLWRDVHLARAVEAAHAFSAIERGEAGR